MKDIIQVYQVRWQNNLDCESNSPNNSYWYLDVGASAHMTPSSSTLDGMEPYSGNQKVLIGNGNVLPICHIGSRRLNSTLHLPDILVVPGLQTVIIGSRIFVISIYCTFASFQCNHRNNYTNPYMASTLIYSFIDYGL